ncbi:MAG TPA: ribosome-associated translation inhibitor RaiA [Peptococcaceae bacterium]|nr:ribosome-associated translation inhibitor RaiA [Peptococcaceae bacterium]
MKIIVRGKNFEVTDALREWVEKKLGKIEKYFNDLKEIQVVLVVNRDRHRAEVTIPLDGIVLRGEEETGDMYSSVDMVIDKLEKQIKKYKTKIDRKLKNGSIKDLKVPRGELQAEYEEPKIVRTKRFAMKPMTVEEAILQMNLVGHNFFVFRNSETDMVNVVYQRKDGNYGLIEPEY